MRRRLAGNISPSLHEKRAAPIKRGPLSWFSY